MKPLFHALSAGAILATSLMLSGVAQAAPKTVTIEVNGLYCASCPYIAAQAITAVKSTEITDGYYDAGQQMAQYVVTYDDAVTTPDAIAAAPAEYGYDGKIIAKITGDS